MKLEGIHHITAITGDAPGQRRVLHRRARPADGQADGQPGRPDRLPPLLRRRGRLAGHGPDVLRVPGRRARERRARAWSTASSGGWPRRRRSTSGRSACSAHGVRAAAATARACSSPTPRGSSTSCSVSTAADEPLSADSPEIPRRARAAGLRRVRAPTAATRRTASGLLERGARLHARSARRAGRCAGTSAAASTRTTPRRPSQPRARAPAACTTSPSPRRWTTTRPGAQRAIEGGRAPDAGDRPLLLPLGLLPRAERRAVRDRHDRPRLRGRRGRGAPRRAALAAAARSSRCASSWRPRSRRCPTRRRGGWPRART